LGIGFSYISYTDFSAGGLHYSHNGTSEDKELLNISVWDGEDASVANLEFNIIDEVILGLTLSPDTVTVNATDGYTISTDLFNVEYDGTSDESDFIFDISFQDNSPYQLLVDGTEASVFTFDQLNSDDVVIRAATALLQAESHFIEFNASNGEANYTLSLERGYSLNYEEYLQDGVSEIERGEQITLTEDHIVVNDPETRNENLLIGYRINELAGGEIVIDDGVNTNVFANYLYFSYSDLVQGRVHYLHGGSNGETDSVRFIVSDFSGADFSDLSIEILDRPVDLPPKIEYDSNLSRVQENVRGSEIGVIGTLIVDDIKNGSKPNVTINDSRFQLDYIESKIEEKHVYALSLKDTSSLNYEKEGLGINNRINLSITIEDGLTKTSQNVRLFVGDQNDAPVMVHDLGKISLQENSDVETIGIIRVFDEDADETPELTIEDNAYFHIEYDNQNDAGEQVYRLIQSEPINYEDTNLAENKIISLSIATKDSVTSVRDDINILVEDVNETPELSVLTINDDIKENSPGVVIGSIQISDEDANEDMSVKVDDDRFELLPTQGGNDNEFNYTLVLKDETALDYELDADKESGTMSVSVGAIDSAENVVSQAISFQLLDVTEDDDSPIDSTTDSLGLAEVDTQTGLDQTTTPFPSVSEVDTSDSENDVVLVTEVLGKTDTVSISTDDSDDETDAESVTDSVSGNDANSVRDSDSPTSVLSGSEPILGEASGVSANTLASSAASNQRYTGADYEELEGVYGADVDLHKLIKPVASFGKLELANTQNNVDFQDGTLPLVQLIQGMDIQALQRDFVYSTAGFKAQSELLTNAIEEQAINENERFSGTRAVIGTTTGLSTGISVGYLLWLVRGGTLMGSVLSTLPAWRFVDPFFSPLCEFFCSVSRLLLLIQCH